MPLRVSQEFLQRQVRLVKAVEPEYFAWVNDALRALPSGTPEPIVSVDDLCAFVQGEGYADYWRKKYGMHFVGFSTINGVQTYEGAHSQTIEHRWRDAYGHRDDGVAQVPERYAQSGHCKPTLPHKPLSETGLYTRLSLPPELPPSAGFRTIPQMELIVQDTCPLWSDVPAPPLLTAKELGLTGSLEQIWVAQAAVQQFETIRRGLFLPFPQTFYEQHPGRIMVVRAHVFQFDNPEAPYALLAHFNFTYRGHVAEGGSDLHQARPCAMTIRGGLSFQQLGNESETQYQWDWGAGMLFNDIRVVGYDLAVEHAHALALSLGNDASSDNRA